LRGAVPCRGPGIPGSWDTIGFQKEREKRGEWGPWLWRVTYWLSRQREAAKRAGRDEALYRDLLEKLSGKNFAQHVGTLSLAARWAELETRKTQGGEG